MNKKNKLLNIWAGLFIALCSVFVFTTCNNTDELSTNILDSGSTTMRAFGPNPALRGQKLTFAGTHLDQITKVILPNNVEITDIEVVSDKIIRVIVPLETMPGIVQLIGPNKLVISSKDSLTISEPVEITAMTPQPVKAGQVLTIAGNYFDLMTKLIFTDNVTVLATDPAVKSWIRTKIEIVLPAQAQTGNITLQDDAQIPLEYQSPTALQVVLPSVNAVADLTGKRPGDVISIPGKDLDLVVNVQVPNSGNVPFTIDNSTLTFTLPATASDGAVVMIPASNVQVVVANIGVAMPDQVVATPATGLRAGNEITIKGINLDMVTDIKFPGVTDAVTPTSKTATEIKVNMPDMAISGNLVLWTASGRSVAIPIETQKPDVVSYSPAIGGSVVTLQGHNLDLVSTVTFISNLVVSVTPSAADNLDVTVPLNAVSGVVILTMANGETVECPSLDITPPPFAYLPNPPGPKAEIHAGQVLTLTAANGDKLTDVQINGQSVTYIIDAPNNTLTIIVPSSASGNTELKLVSSNGTAVYTIPVIGAGVTEIVMWEGLLVLSGWNNGSIPNKNFGDARVGDRVRFYISNVNPAGDGIQVFYGDWGGQIVPETIQFADGDTYFEITLTADMIQHMLNPAWGADAMVIQGDGVTIYKITLISGNEPTVTTLWTGSVGPIGWSGSDLVGPVDVSLLSAGQTMGIDFVVDSGGGQMEVMAGSWWTGLEGWTAMNGGERYIRDCDPSETNIEFVITQTDIDNITQQGSALLICGGGITIKKLYVK